MSSKPELLRLRDKVIKIKNELYLVWEKIEGIDKDLSVIDQEILNITKEKK